MKIRSIKYLLSILTLGFMIVACVDDDSGEVTPEVVIPTTEFAIPGAGSTETLSIKSNVSLELKSDQEWCAVTRKESESTSVYTYYLTVAANTASPERIARIIVTGGSYTDTVKVKQSIGDQFG